MNPKLLRAEATAGARTMAATVMMAVAVRVKRLFTILVLSKDVQHIPGPGLLGRRGNLFGELSELTRLDAARGTKVTKNC